MLIIDLEFVIDLDINIIFCLLHIHTFCVDPDQKASIRRIIIGHILPVFLKHHMYIRYTSPGDIHKIIIQFDDISCCLGKSLVDFIIDDIMFSIFFIITAGCDQFHGFTLSFR